MESFDTEAFAAALALIGAVIMLAALISGLIERSNFPQVAVFLAMGAVLGPAGLGLLDITLDSPMLRVIATLSLALVLFTDALSLNIREVRTEARLAFRLLGPGAILSAGLIALAGWWLLGLPVAAAVIVGAALASTDPVLLRGLVRRNDIPQRVRQALRLESGLNDVVLLPIVLVAMVFLEHSAGSGQVDWGRMFLDLFILGPGAGVLVGLLGVATLDLVRRRIGVRRDYESLYSLGVAFAAFACAEALHGSGFLAAFAAGLTIAALDVELCDCFLEYGETTAEMALLFTFVLFGSSLIWSGLAVLTWTTFIFAVLVLALRPLAFLLALAKTRLSRYERFLISWFGPRGLSTLLLVLLPVFAGLEGSANLFAICSLVVLLSVVLHGGSLTLLGRRLNRNNGDAQSYQAVPAAVQPAGGEGSERLITPVDLEWAPVGPANGHRQTEDHQAEIAPTTDRERISIEQVRQLQESGEQVVIVDARTERTFDSSGMVARGAVRIVPSANIVRQAEEAKVPRDAWVAIFCA